MPPRLLHVAVMLIAGLGAARAGSGAAKVTFRPQDGSVNVLIDGQPFTTFHHAPRWAKPFLHPLRTGAGLEVTRRFPFEQVPGETTDHPHHRGVWYAHGDINGVDYWGEAQPGAAAGKRFGRTVLKSPPVVRGSTLTAECDLVPDGGPPAGSLRQSFTFRSEGPNRIVDAAVTLMADRKTPLKMGDIEEGCFGVRLADEFRQDRGAVLSNADGLVGTEKIWGKRAPWVDYSTTLRGEKAGVTLLDHPRNPKYPTYWHARGYGLCAANPFGEHDFHQDPKRDGSVTIPAGESLTFRYRLVVHPGGLDPAAVRRWQEQLARETR